MKNTNHFIKTIVHGRSTHYEVLSITNGVARTVAVFPSYELASQAFPDAKRGNHEVRPTRNRKR